MHLPTGGVLGGERDCGQRVEKNSSSALNSVLSAMILLLITAYNQHFYLTFSGFWCKRFHEDHGGFRREPLLHVHAPDRGMLHSRCWRQDLRLERSVYQRWPNLGLLFGLVIGMHPNRSPAMDSFLGFQCKKPFGHGPSRKLQISSTPITNKDNRITTNGSGPQWVLF